MPGVGHASAVRRQGDHWLPTPLTRMRSPYSPLLAVMNSVCRSRPPKQTFAVHGSSTAMCSTF